MKRLLRGSVVLAVAAGFLSCSGDPTSDLREPAGIVATPTTVFVDVGETEPVLASLRDDQGNQIGADFEITDVGPGISVVQDTAHLHTNAGVSIGNSELFQVTASAIANTSFTLNAGGQSLVVPVRVTPATVEIGISNPAPNWGDTITLTAPAGALFTDSSAVTFAGGPPGDVVSISPDRTALTVVPGPNTAGAVSIANTTVSYNESLNFTITSNGTVTSPPLTDLTGAVLSNPTPALGEVVTLTLPAGIKVLPVPLLPDGSIGVLADSGIVIQGATNPADVVVSADSSSISFVPAPNSDSVITIRGIVPSVLPQFPQILSTPIDTVAQVALVKLTSPAIDSLAAGFSDVAPDILEDITVTAPAGFTFSRDSLFVPTEEGTDTIPRIVAFTWGGLEAVLQSIAADGKSAVITPLPGSNGHASISNVIVDAAPQFRLTLPATVPLVVPPITPLEGTETPTTAPEITVPGVGASITVTDAGSFGYSAPTQFGAVPARLYKILLPGPVSLSVELDWPTGEDMGVYYFAADGVTEVGTFADAGFDGDAPETSTSVLAAGTYYVAVVNWSASSPPVFQLTLSR
ncbi:MAG TPA: hypothetical protein VJ808_08360 [Gemmatimonadales bacterium]|nr:hypothetical protein [Gemmatimonadales bacterium]